MEFHGGIKARGPSSALADGPFFYTLFFSVLKFGLHYVNCFQITTQKS